MRQLKPNALILAGLLAALQVTFLVLVNGNLAGVLLGGAENVHVLAVIFSPTAALVWALKALSKD